MTHRDMRIHRRLRVRMRVRTLSEQGDDRRRSTCILRMRKRVRTSAERRDASCRSERIPMMRILARTTMVRTVLRMIQRIQRVQQGAVSRTTMRVRALTHPGANLRQRTVEMDAPDVIIAAEALRRRMLMTPVRRCVAVTVSNRAPSMVRVRSSRFGHSSRTAHPTTNGVMRTSWRI